MLLRSSRRLVLNATLIFALTLLASSTAFVHNLMPQAGRDSDWAFSVLQGRTVSSNITATNSCFKRHRFSIKLENLPFLRLLESPEFSVDAGKAKVLPVEISAAGLEPGEYSTGRVRITCDTCKNEKGCTQDYQILNVRMIVLSGSTTPSPTPTPTPVVTIPQPQPGPPPVTIPQPRPSPSTTVSVPQPSPARTSTGVDPPRLTTTGDVCDLKYEWRKGPAISAPTTNLRYWPQDQDLQKMRPGDVIGISMEATDADYLVQRCTDCKRGETLKKWGPYADRVIYTWRLDGKGRLIESDNSEKNRVMYQIPICGWDPKQQGQSATVSLHIGNDPKFGKAADDPVIGFSITFNMRKDSGAELPGWIKVSVEVTDGKQNEDEKIVERQKGTCLPQKPTWLYWDSISTEGVSIKDAPDLCPNYLTLLSVEATDTDMVKLECRDTNPECMMKYDYLKARDVTRYEWFPYSTKGTLPPGSNSWRDPKVVASYFPLGNKGPVVAFRRSRSLDVDVVCVVTDSLTQAEDGPKREYKSVIRARRPKAFVGIGDDDDTILALFDVKIIDLQRAAEKAKEKYEAAGYEVEHNPSATMSELQSAIKTSCYQALWITGHGAEGFIFMKKPPQSNGFGAYNLGELSNKGWGCEQEPFARELVLLGCNTFDKDWVNYLVRGRVYSFDRYLVGNIIGQILNRNPFVWEKNEHQPPAPHNLSAP